MPVCLLSSDSSDRAWFLSHVSVNVRESTDSRSLVCPDIYQFDEFLKDIRFLACVRLVVHGEVVGSLCLMDNVPRRDFDDDMKKNLEDCADMIEATITRKCSYGGPRSPHVVAPTKNVWTLDERPRFSSRDDYNSSDRSGNCTGKESDRASFGSRPNSKQGSRPSSKQSSRVDGDFDSMEDIRLVGGLRPPSASSRRNVRAQTDSHSPGWSISPPPFPFSADDSSSFTAASVSNDMSAQDGVMDFDAADMASSDVSSKHTSKLRSVVEDANLGDVDEVNIDIDDIDPELEPCIEAPVLSFRYSISGNFAHNTATKPSSSSSTKSSTSAIGNSRCSSPRDQEGRHSRQNSRPSSAARNDNDSLYRPNEYSSAISMNSFNESNCDSDTDEPSVIMRDHIKILLMEDSVLVQKILRNLFVQHGCEVIVAKNGRIGLEMLKNEDFDIAFIDFFMPIQDGVTTMKLWKTYMTEMRAKPDYVKGSIINDELIIVGISDVASDVDKSEARFNDMDIFCSKPLDPEILQILLSARRNSTSFAVAVEQITREIDAKMKSNLARVTELGTKRAENETTGMGVGMGYAAAKPADANKEGLRKKPTKKHTPPPKSWWRTLTSSFSPPAAETAVVTTKKDPKKAAPIKRAPPAVNYMLHLNGVDPNRIKVLIMDDSVAILKIISRTFQKNGCDVSTAPNGQVGLEMLQKEEFDICLVDFHMPVMDGITAMRHFNEWVASEKAWIAKGYSGSSSGSSSSKASKHKGAVKNENMILIGMSDSITRTENEHVFDDNSMHFFCGKPVSQDLLLIILKATKNYDNVDDMLVYIEQNAAKLFSEQHKPVYNWAQTQMKNLTKDLAAKVTPL